MRRDREQKNLQAGGRGIQPRPLLCRAENTPLRRNLARKLQAASFSFLGYPCYRLGGQDAPADAPLLLYLHGGGYVGGITGAQWLLAEKICQSCAGAVLVPLFPLHSAVETFRWLSALLEHLRTEQPACPSAVLGDSSGGGLALTLALLHPDAFCALHLLAPSMLLDGKVEGADALLPLPALRARWGAGLSASDLRLSPLLFVRKAALPPLHVLSGRQDPLHRQALLLKQQQPACRLTVLPTGDHTSHLRRDFRFPADFWDVSLLLRGSCTETQKSFVRVLQTPANGV